MLLFKLAVLNIGRNPRRSVITVLAISVGLSALIFLWGFSDGTTEQQRENVIRLFTGHLQIHEKGFEKNMDPELFLQDKEFVLKQIQESSHFIRYSERIKSEALIGTSDNSRGVLLMGIDPIEEPKIIDLENSLIEGSFLELDKDREILIGDRLASKLSTGIGKKVVVMTQAMDGTLAGYSYRVKGIFSTGSQQVDEFSAYITLNSAQDLLGLENEVHEIVIQLDDRKSIPAYRSSLSSELSSDQYEILSWDEIVPEVEQWVQWSSGVIQTILITVTFVIGVGIMNTILMSIFERTKELGVMLAIGTTPQQIISLIFLETLVLQIIGILIGLIGGYSITYYFGETGLAFSGVEEAFSTTFMSTVVYTRVEAAHVMQSIVTLVLLTSFIGIYPAWKAATMNPVKAIYHS